MPDLARFEGRIALVTGAAAGIGAATARRLAAEGARVLAGDLDLDGAREVASEVDGIAVGVDVTDDASVTTAVAEMLDSVGRIDVLVNNAGGGRGEPKFFTETGPEDWDMMLDLNLRSVLAVTRAVLPAMHEQGSGAIVSVSSEAGRAGSALNVIYSAAKAGVIGFTKAIALESARYGVRANAVAPGPTRTPLLDSLGESRGDLGARLVQGMIDATAMKRPGTAEEIAAAIAYLASDDASWVTGQTLNVSGGLSMP